MATLAALAMATANAGQPADDSLGDLSLEQLGNVDITSVSGRTQHLSDAPASIYVISGDDIRRSGATTLPEALRLAPNLEVARVSAGTYAISARGFNNSLGNKLLVLIDGRIVYTPLFSGVFWDAQDVLLEDVEQIEVISGPGATLWGANAVNGVINVITRRAAKTRGLLVATERGGDGNISLARYGGAIGDDGSFRVYAKHDEIAHTETASDQAIEDSFRRDQAGFRVDWGDADRGLTIQGDAYHGQAQEPVFGPVRISGFNLLADWNRRGDDGSSQRLIAYVDRAQRDDPVEFQDRMDIVDLEYQRGFRSGSHDVMWGLGYRHAQDDTKPGLLTAFVPATRSMDWEDAFAQDEIRLADSLRLTVGARVDRNIYTGTEFLPSIRLAWKPAERHLFWGELSRAVREPSRIDEEFRFPGHPPFLITGGPDFVSELSDVAEIGYRGQPANAFTWSATLFFQNYENLRSGEQQPDGSFQVVNGTAGRVWGAEVWGSLQLARRWQLSAGLSGLRESFHTRSGFHDPDGAVDLGNDPRHQWSLRSTFEVTPALEFNVMTRSVGALPAPLIPAYTAVDANLDWRVNRHVELALFGQNLFGAGHVEFAPGPLVPASVYDRSANLRLELSW